VINPLGAGISDSHPSQKKRGTGHPLCWQCPQDQKAWATQQLVTCMEQEITAV